MSQIWANIYTVIPSHDEWPEVWTPYPDAQWIVKVIRDGRAEPWIAETIAETVADATAMGLHALAALMCAVGDEYLHPGYRPDIEALADAMRGEFDEEVRYAQQGA